MNTINAATPMTASPLMQLCERADVAMRAADEALAALHSSMDRLSGDVPPDGVEPAADRQMWPFGGELAELENRIFRLEILSRGINRAVNRVTRIA